MATPNRASGTQALQVRGHVRETILDGGLLVLIPGCALGAVRGLAQRERSGRGRRGVAGRQGWSLGGVKDVLGALMSGGIGLIIGIFLSVLVIALVSRGKRQRYWRQTFQAYVYLSPAVIVMLMFTFISMIYAFYVSLHKFGLAQIAGKKSPEFVGLGNYAQAMSGPAPGSEFWKSLITTLWLTLGSIPVQ